MTTAGAQRMVREKPEVMELKSTEYLNFIEEMICLAQSR